jgi:precorrin-2 dehydrogenase/sirohydrochlorin ferrochelatase
MSTPMFPVVFDLSSTTAFVVGGDAAAAHRVRDLHDHGAARVVQFTPDAGEPAGQEVVIRRWPAAADFEAHRPRLVFVTAAPEDVIDQVVDLARARNATIHVQDRIDRCDFHLPARLRRGRLLVTVSTDGAAAGLSRLLRDHLAVTAFGHEWADRVEQVAAARTAWKTRGLTMAALFTAIADFVRQRGWLPSAPGSISAVPSPPVTGHPWS